MSRVNTTPVIAHDYLTLLLEGDSGQQVGLAKLLDWVDHMQNDDLPDAPESTQTEMWRNLSYANVYAAIFHENRETLKLHIDRLKNLLNHPDMEQAYNHLTKASLSEKQWHGFLSGSMRAAANYSHYRDSKKEAIRISKKIAAATAKLTDLLNDLVELNFDNTPEEFWSVRKLLLSSVDSDSNEFSKQLWRMSNPSILGRDIAPLNHSIDKSVLREIPFFELYQDRIHTKVLQSYSMMNTPPNTSPAPVQYAWTAAPSLQSLLQTLGTVADSYEPHLNDVFSAATIRRQSNLKTQYVRAFGHILSKEYGVSFSSDMLHAIALTGGVILGDIDHAIPSYEEVKNLIEAEPE